MSTLWSKGTQATELVDDFTVGNDRVLDLRLAKYDVLGSKAHIKMLESIGLLSAEELEILTEGLDVILKEIEAGDFPDFFKFLKYALIRLLSTSERALTSLIKQYEQNCEKSRIYDSYEFCESFFSVVR